MARHHMVNNVQVPFTEQEEIDRDAEEASETAKKPMSDWQASMQATDASCPRWFEDYVTENSVTLADGKAKDSYDAKVLLRSEKP